MSKEPRPVPKPGEPNYRDPTKPNPTSPPPPPRKTDPLTEQNLTFAIQLKAALAKIEMLEKRILRMGFEICRLDKELYAFSCVWGESKRVKLK